MVRTVRTYDDDFKTNAVSGVRTSKFQIYP